MHYKITLEYDGTNYLGWQKQRDAEEKSVEEIVQEAVFLMTQENVQINAAGRTDAGVHAIGQVADFVIEKEFEPFRMMQGLNNYLRSTAVAVVACQIVADEFHSRFDAKKRHYRYIIYNRKAPLVLQKNRAWHVAQDIDVEKMRRAAKYLIGKHDFSAFRDAECQASSPIKTIDRIDISSFEDKIIIEVSAKSFLHHMVRNIVGTLVWVGIDKIAADEVKTILEKKDRKLSGPNAPACGLYFLGVDY